MQNVGTTYPNKSFGLFYASRRIYNISNEHPQYIDILKLKRGTQKYVEKNQSKKVLALASFLITFCVHLES